jgi:hypothetical protein
MWFDCVQCGALHGGEDRYDRYGIYAGRLCDDCWEDSNIRTWEYNPGEDEPLDGEEDI